MTNSCEKPTPEKILARRKWAGMTQAEAAKACCVSLNTWGQWEAETGTDRSRQMSATAWKLFCIETKKKRS